MSENPWRVVGHSLVKKYIDQRLAAHSMPQAVLCVGPEGVGKRLLVRELAARLGAADLEVMECDCAAVTVQELRQFLDRMSLRPAQGTVQVALFDHAEALTPAMANALLKTLEEPPAHGYFFLVSNQPNLLPTIASRCVQLRFGALLVQECEEILGDAYKPAFATVVSQVGPGAFVRDPEFGLRAQAWNAEWQELVTASDFRRILLAQRLSAEEGPVLQQRLRVWLAQARTAVVDVGYTRRATVLQEALRRLARNANRKLVAEYVCLNV
ncbi:MAG: AAA family ATPase [Candidatus Doudnabacteria bacterium]|nr:AAA family ATPase [Candidatus Doudnabacteria bacterium]